MRSPGHYCCFAAFLIGWGIAGCDSVATWPLGAKKAGDVPSSSPAVTSTTKESSAGKAAPGVHVVHMNFDILRVDFPLESARHSLKVWNHVDRGCLEPRTVSKLARNGLRVGVANPDTWPAVQAILSASKARVNRQEWEGQTGLPVVAALGSIQEPESIFSYDDAGRLSGKTFSAGEKLMQLDYAVLAQGGGAVETRLTFEVRHDRGEMTWESAGGVVRQVPAYDRHVFTDLAATIIVPLGATLIIGPDERAAQEYLVGARFLEHDRDATAHETMYFITPRPTRTIVPGALQPRSPPKKE